MRALWRIKTGGMSYIPMYQMAGQFEFTFPTHTQYHEHHPVHGMDCVGSAHLNYFMSVSLLTCWWPMKWLDYSDKSQLLKTRNRKQTNKKSCWHPTRSFTQKQNNTLLVPHSPSSVCTELSGTNDSSWSSDLQWLPFPLELEAVLLLSKQDKWFHQEVSKWTSRVIYVFILLLKK